MLGLGHHNLTEEETLMVHPKATLTPRGRLLLVRRVEELNWHERHDVQRADLRRPAGVLQTDIAAHHPAELDLAVPAGDDTRGIEELADLLDRHVGGERLGGIRELETERAQGRLSGIHAQDPSRPCGEQPRSTSSARPGRTVGKRLAWPAAHHHPEPVKGWLTCPTWL
ncbi:MAG: hypothetical protein AUH75_08930 [Gemmatimonadetes bacterium 13_1_40CM_4_65_7]|nr:MAG: hypothetical protein AUH75_08930 [Gemmatimonadetes bacterium 13_1_40CM_4_65_7]